MSEQSQTTNYRDVMREQMHRQYAAELKEAGWVVLHESDFTVDSFHTDPYFHAVVTRIARWYENPTDPPDPDELGRAQIKRAFLAGWTARGMRDEAANDASQESATHTNYNTGEPCYCDARFGGVSGPCIDEEPVVDGTDPVNGTG